MAARLLRAPMAVLSLVGAEQEEFLGMFGLPASPAARRRTGEHLVCANVVAADGPLAVPDMTADPQFAEHPAFTGHGIRAFAGVPLRDGQDRQVGALSVLDDGPHDWSETDLSTLVEITAMLGPVPVGADPVIAMAALTDLDQSGSAADAPAAAVSATVHAEVQAGFITALLDSLQVGVFAVDTDRRPVLFNRTLRQFYGLPEDLTPAEAMAGAYTQLRHLDGTPYATDELATVRALREGSVRDVRAVMQAPDMPDRHILTNAEAIHDAAGHLLGAVATVQDVTDRRRRERFRDCELRVAGILNRCDTIAEAAPPILRAVGEALHWQYLALLLIDEVADVLRVAACWSAPGVEVGGLLPDMIGRGDAETRRLGRTDQPLPLSDLVDSHLIARHAAQTIARAAADQGLRASLAVPIRDADTILGVLVSLSSTAECDRVLLAGLLTSVTAQLGQFLIHRRNAELQAQLVHAKDDFLTLVGHEMRTPLTSIISYSTLLADELIEPELGAVVAAITRNTSTLQSIIDELLDLAGLEAGNTSLQLRPTHLTEIVNAAVTAVPVDAQRRIHTDMPPTLLVEADPHRLRQIIDHLLSNAIKYSPDGGDIRISAHEHDTGVVELAVVDPGIGIPAEDHQQLFTRFHRAGNTRHSYIPGTGLGLALVRALVHAHGGTITYDPHHRPGTRITLRLPQHHSGAGKPGNAVPGSGTLNGYRTT
ncbi:MULTISPECIES: ATP-binding protein [unclassified Actinoplanes]|uniref:sensor histidine kinase n=1 Tax=unclassified Actinoplanes TaxID=2626549 RepID=UPI0015616BEE|nr:MULTISPECIES: ATP-binding protein [unclassified Actinoplanes]